MHFVTERLPETGSTNDELKKRAGAGAPAFTVLVADRQTAGKGRLGRSFESPAGGLYFSLLLREQADAASLVTAAAVCVCRACETLTDIRCDVKWVNDVYAGGKKVCGILAESAFAPDGGFAYTVLGIGVNLSAAALSRAPDTAGALFDGTAPDGFRDRLLDEILRQLSALLPRLADKPHLSEYRRRMFLTGRDVTVHIGETFAEARVLGIDDDFRLQVRYADGTAAALSSGEVTRIRL